MECICALIQAEDSYDAYGGLQDPCEGPSYVNMAGATLNAYSLNQYTVVLTWESVAREFVRVEATGKDHYYRLRPS